MAKLRGDANLEYIEQYGREHYRHFKVRINRFKNAELLEWLEGKLASGESINKLVTDLLLEEMEREKG